MKKTDDAMQAATALLDKAKHEIYDNMEARGFAAVIWDLSSAGFHYIPEIFIRPATGKGKTDVVRIAGLYAYDGTLYAIEEDNPAVDFNKFYNPDDEVRPVVVTLTAVSATRARAPDSPPRAPWRNGSPSATAISRPSPRSDKRHK